MAQQFLTPPKRMLLGLFGLLAAVCLLVGVLVYDSRVAAFDNASMQIDTVSAIVTDDIARNLEIFDLSLHGVIDDLRNPTIMASPPYLRQLILFDRAGNADFLGAVRVLDQNGFVSLDSSTLNPSHDRLMDTEFFKHHAIDPGDALFIGGPVVQKGTGGQAITLSHRLSRPDGSFSGVVVGTIDVEYFRRLFAKAKLREGGTLTLVRDDGTILMRSPNNPGLIGKRLHGAVERANGQAGFYRKPSAIDGVERLFAYHRVGSFPVVQTAGIAIADIYGDWLQKVAATLAMLALCSLVVIWLVVRLRAEFSQRERAEQALMRLADEDGLTGLANRRALDRCLLEAGQAAGSARPLALLIFDVDHFKDFNDRFGHLAGDDHLCRLAAILKDYARRPGRMAARYGGEEFVLLLPDVDAEMALAIAEAIRSDVEGLAQAGTLDQCSTVSVGVAGFVGDGWTVRDLFSAADAALYASKSAGRNCTTLSRTRDQRVHKALELVRPAAA